MSLIILARGYKITVYLSMMEKVKHELNKLIKQLKSHIWFPKNNVEGYFFRYGITFFLGLLIILFIVVFPQKESKTTAFILFLISIVLSSLFGNLQGGLLLTGFAAPALIIFYYPPTSLTLLHVIEIISFILGGALISVCVHICKRADLVSEFVRKEEYYQKQIRHLEIQKEAAENEIRVREEFISIASHELKTPLTTTLLKLQNALHNIQHVTLANFSVQNLLDMLEGAELQTKRLGKMINDLLNVSIIRTGRLELELEDCKLSDIAEDVVHRFTEKAEKDGVEIRLEPSENFLCTCDKVRLEQVMTNLISNAMKYGNGKPVDIKVWKSGKIAKVRVKDHGIGISKEKRDTIFNLFERAVGNSQYKGLGIGLYISNQIVKAHSGKITVNSKMNHGSEFVVEIPVK